MYFANYASPTLNNPIIDEQQKQDSRPLIGGNTKLATL
jgi:hypothetical protein